MVGSDPRCGDGGPHGRGAGGRGGGGKVPAPLPGGRFRSRRGVGGIAAEKYASEEDLADELKLPDPYVAVRLNRLS